MQNKAVLIVRYCCLDACCLLADWRQRLNGLVVGAIILGPMPPNGLVG